LCHDANKLKLGKAIIKKHHIIVIVKEQHSVTDMILTRDCFEIVVLQTQGAKQ